ncbi:MAG: transglutaminase family protein, partial [Planctomycetales bacterium]|nr:transglutaminase family protein [Planctomycetales bacterium]
SDRLRRRDYFGNHTESFAVYEPHEKMSVTATSVVEVAASVLPSQLAIKRSTAWPEVVRQMQADVSANGLRVRQYAFASTRISITDAVKQYATVSFTANRPILDAALELNSRIHKDFQYDPRATNVTSSIEDVLQLRRGVCQDFAHLQLACLRAVGLPARYVSGYLRTIPPSGQPRLVGADASHAWISLFCGATGWVDFDATNDVIPHGEHVTVAWGRDYSDVCPVQGVFVGGGQHVMSVEVDVNAMS